MPDTPSIALLRRLREWDMFSIPSGDNEYWTAEIDKVLAGYETEGALINKLVAALRVVRVKSHEIDAIVDRALAIPDSQL